MYLREMPWVRGVASTAAGIAVVGRMLNIHALTVSPFGRTFHRLPTGTVSEIIFSGTD
jgi:hypothetical protein